MATTEALRKLIEGLGNVSQYGLLLQEAVSIQADVNDADTIITDGVIIDQIGLILRHSTELLHGFVTDPHMEEAHVPVMCPVCKSALWERMA